MNRQELIAAMQEASKPRAVVIDGWGTIYIRALTIAEVDAQDDDTTEKVMVDGKEVEVKVRDKYKLTRACARLLSDADGNRLFDPEKHEDVVLLGQQPWKFLRRVLEESNDVVKEKQGN